jgi:hypothetical protein
MMIKQFNTGPNEYSTQWRISMLAEDEKKELIEEISQLQNSDQWEILSN